MTIVDGLVEVGVADVKLPWIDTNDWPLVVSQSGLAGEEIKYTIFIM